MQYRVVNPCKVTSRRELPGAVLQLDEEVAQPLVDTGSLELVLDVTQAPPQEPGKQLGADDKGADDKGADDKGADDKGADDKGADDKAPTPKKARSRKRS